MKCELTGDKIVVLQDEIDIYDAPDLREKIISMSTINNPVVLDLQNVEGISTPIIQVLMAAKKDLQGFKVLNINDGVRKNLNLFGLYL